MLFSVTPLLSKLPTNSASTDHRCLSALILQPPRTAGLAPERRWCELHTHRLLVASACLSHISHFCFALARYPNYRTEESNGPAAATSDQQSCPGTAGLSTSLTKQLVPLSHRIIFACLPRIGGASLGASVRSRFRAEDGGG